MFLYMYQGRNDWTGMPEVNQVDLWDMEKIPKDIDYTYQTQETLEWPDMLYFRKENTKVRFKKQK